MADSKSQGALQAAAGEIKDALDNGRSLELLSGRIGGFGISDAYAVAHRVHEMRRADGSVPVGRKIGFTNPDIWPTYGVHEPFWFYVYDSTVRHVQGAESVCELTGLVEPRIEPEIVLHFDSAPPITDDVEEILSCIDWIANGFEIAQSHWPGWKFEASDAIADCGLHGRLIVGKPMAVTGPASALATALEEFTITLSCDGEVRDQGRGSNVLGSPLKAIAHLIAVIEKADRPAPLQAGELVTTGTLTAAFPVQAGQRWSTELKGIDLPGCSVTFLNQD